MPIKVAYLKFFLSFRFFQHLSFIIIIIIIIIIIVSTGTIYCRIQEDANVKNQSTTFVRIDV